MVFVFVFVTVVQLVSPRGRTQVRNSVSELSDKMKQYRERSTVKEDRPERHGVLHLGGVFVGTRHPGTRLGCLTPGPLLSGRVMRAGHAPTPGATTRLGRRSPSVTSPRPTVSGSFGCLHRNWGLYGREVSCYPPGRTKCPGDYYGCNSGSR